jgi:hypothetical protein
MNGVLRIDDSRHKKLFELNARFLPPKSRIRFFLDGVQATLVLETNSLSFTDGHFLKHPKYSCRKRLSNIRAYVLA